MTVREFWITPLAGIRRLREFLSSNLKKLEPRTKHLSSTLRLVIFSLSVMAILLNLAALTILFTCDNRASGFISGGDPKQFYRELQTDLLDDYGKVFGIAHNSGNKVSTAIEALAYDADIIEIDVILVKGKLYAAHWSPFSFLGTRFFRGPTLEEVWGTAAQAEVVKLDLKRATPEMADKFLEFLSNGRRANTEVIVVSDKPEILDIFAQRKSSVIRMLSVSDDGVMSSLSSDADLLNIIDGVSINHHMLTADSTQSLKEGGLIIFAYTVNDPKRMNELVEYGVDGITTDNLAIMQLLGSQQRDEITLKGQLQSDTSN